MNANNSENDHGHPPAHGFPSFLATEADRPVVISWGVGTVAGTELYPFGGEIGIDGRNAEGIYFRRLTNVDGFGTSTSVAWAAEYRDGRLVAYLRNWSVCGVNRMDRLVDMRYDARVLVEPATFQPDIRSLVGEMGTPVAPRATKTRHNISLSEGAAAIFDRLGNASAYLEGMLLQQEAEWRAAVAELRVHGFRYGEILVIADRAPIAGAKPRRGGVERFGHLLEGVLIDLAVVLPAGSASERWRALRALVQAQRNVVIALDVVAFELALGNQRLRALLAADGAEPAPDTRRRPLCPECGVGEFVSHEKETEAWSCGHVIGK